MDEDEKQANEIYRKYISNKNDIIYDNKLNAPGEVRRKGYILNQRANTLRKHLHGSLLSDNEKKEILSAIETYEKRSSYYNLID